MTRDATTNGTDHFDGGSVDHNTLTKTDNTSPIDGEEKEARAYYNNNINNNDEFPFAKLESDNSNGDPDLAVLLRHQVQTQQHFQTMLWNQQHPPEGTCQNQRVLLSADLVDNKPADGFAREIQESTRFLGTALATHRIAVYQPFWYSAYCPWWNHTESNLSKGYECLWEPITNCSYRQVLGINSTHPANHTTIPETSLPSQLDDTGIADGISEPHSHYFNVYLFGPARLRTHRKWPWGRNAHIDHAGSWERTHGRFWVRSQLAHHLWKPQPWLQDAIQQRRPTNLTKPFIGMHIRFTDNRNDLQRYFGRDAQITRAFPNFMKRAQRIQNRYNISSVYIATDFDHIIQTEIKRRIYRKKPNKAGFTFYIQNGPVERGSSKRFLWFKDFRQSGAASIATDLAVLREADFLIGSHQSNVFRLACQLNTAYHTPTYAWDQDRHQTVDVEWFEDP